MMAVCTCTRDRFEWKCTKRALPVQRCYILASVVHTLLVVLCQVQASDSCSCAAMLIAPLYDLLFVLLMYTGGVWQLE
jgi:hypothetical protein